MACSCGCASLGGALAPPVEAGESVGLVYGQEAPSWRSAWAEVYHAEGSLLWYAHGGGAPASGRLAPGDSFVVRLDGAPCLPRATSSCSALAQAPLRVARASSGGGELGGPVLLYAGEAGVLAPAEEPEATWAVQVGRAERWATGPGCSEAPPAEVSVVITRLEAVR
jgi:hypothetical protein